MSKSVREYKVKAYKEGCNERTYNQDELRKQVILENNDLIAMLKRRGVIKHD